jgi:hypothetical protein
MGCSYHDIGNGVRVKFNELDDSTSCLCTFDFIHGDIPTISHIRSLAMLGAACEYANQLWVNGSDSDKRFLAQVGTVQTLVPKDTQRAIDEAFTKIGWKKDERVS